MAFNKMFVMIPVMLAARKIDGEDPKIVYGLRIAYGVVQTLCTLIVLYTYVKASAQVNKHRMMIYVPPPPTPFADPNAKKKYTQVSYSAYVLSQARSLLGSTLFGIALTVGLHVYKGMVVGLAMQSIMAPLNLVENPLVKALLFGQGFQPADKIFEEKSGNELTADDEIVDEGGKPVNRIGSTKPTFEEILLDTWDAGNKADVAALMSAIDDKTCNYKTKESGWTPLMILAGLSANGVGSAIRQVKAIGGDPAITDGEGWNALHWAAFHGGLEGARELSKEAGLLAAKDKEGKTPLDMAKSEGNDAVAKLLEAAMQAPAREDKSDTGLRKRK